MAESDNVLTKSHDLLVYLVPQLNRFPRDQKFVLGDRIETKRSRSISKLNDYNFGGAVINHTVTNSPPTGNLFFRPTHP